MCTITCRTRKSIGYKVLAVDSEGNYFSTFTGQLISVGKVPAPPFIAKRLSGNWNSQIDNRDFNNTSFYNPNFAGKTGVFINKEAAIDLLDEIRGEHWFGGALTPVLVKIKLGMQRWSGDYHGYEIIASDTIKSIQLC